MLGNRFILLLMYVLLSSQSVYANDNVEKTYTAHLGELPGLINLDKTGAFVDFIRYLDAQDPSTEIAIEVYPIHRAINGVVRGKADFGLPAIRPPGEVVGLPFTFSEVSFGHVTHVLYTNKAFPLSVETLLSNPSLYRVEAVPYYMPFKVLRSHSIKQSLQRLASGRIDAFIWAQEEADMTLKALGLSGIERTHFGDLPDVFFIPKGEAGKEIDAYLTQLINRLRESGKLESEYRKVHRPYVDWQP
jgi:hypothetical protein